MPLNFYFHGGPVGYFSDRHDLPRIARHLHVRSISERSGTNAQARNRGATGSSGALFGDADAECRLKARVGFELYRIERILELVRVTDDTPPPPGTHIRSADV